MPAPKPAALHSRHSTKAEKKDRERTESALKPRTKITKTPPDELKGHSKAQAVWRYTIKIYGELKEEIVTSLDIGILVDYCLLVEQLHDLEEMRADNKTALEIVRKNLKKITDKSDKKDPLEIIAEQMVIIEKLDALSETFIKLDQRADRKRNLVHTLRQSLYLTPRARAGVAPSGREDEPEMDEMERLLNELT